MNAKSSGRTTLLILCLSAGLLASGGCDTPPRTSPGASKPPLAQPKPRSSDPDVAPVSPSTIVEGEDTRRKVAPVPQRQPEVPQLEVRPPLVADPDAPARTTFRPATPLVVAEFRQPTEQEVAAMALGRIGKAAVPSLVQAMRHRDAEVRKQAALVLARIGPPAEEAVPELTAALDDEDEDVRKAAARALGQIGPAAAGAVPALMRTLVQPKPVPPERR